MIAVCADVGSTFTKVAAIDVLPGNWSRRRSIEPRSRPTFSTASTPR
jgi:hypothetical protein